MCFFTGMGTEIFIRFRGQRSHGKNVVLKGARKHSVFDGDCPIYDQTGKLFSIFFIDIIEIGDC